MATSEVGPSNNKPEEIKTCHCCGASSYKGYMEGVEFHECFFKEDSYDEEKGYCEIVHHVCDNCRKEDKMAYISKLRGNVCQKCAQELKGELSEISQY